MTPGWDEARRIETESKRSITTCVTQQGDDGSRSITLDMATTSELEQLFVVACNLTAEECKQLIRNLVTSLNVYERFTSADLEKVGL